MANKPGFYHTERVLRYGDVLWGVYRQLDNGQKELAELHPTKSQADSVAMQYNNELRGVTQKKSAKKKGKR